MTTPAHTDLRAALDAEHAQRIALQHHAADQAQRVADLEALVAELLACLRLSRGNVASLGPAMAIEPHTPYRPWLAELDRVIAKAEGGAA